MIGAVGQKGHKVTLQAHYLKREGSGFDYCRSKSLKTFSTHINFKYFNITVAVLVVPDL